MTDAEMAKKLEEFNRNTAIFEEKVIQDYLKNHNLEMEKTGTGLWKDVIVPGTGATIEDGKTVSLGFKVYMLNDSLCYSSDEKRPYTFVYGHSDMESGLHEGLENLKSGAKAKLIIPSHLGHGLMGDMKKIPPKTPAIYDIEVLSVR